MTRVKEEVYQEQSQIYHYSQGTNQFLLTDEQKNNINKRLPRGFTLLKLPEIPKISQNVQEIQYVAIKRAPRIASQQLNKQFLAQPIINNQFQTKELGRNEIGVDKAGLRFSQLPQGKSKQAQKIKNILQRFRKHYRYPAFAQHLQKIGFINAFLQIEAENKKNIHTIDSFKDRMMFVFKQTKQVTYQQTTISLINQLVDEFLFHVEQARKLQFETSLINIQKSIDKVTRQISEIKETGNYYYKKKKRNEKNYDEKELLHISDLIRQLPKKQLVGVLQIIQQKPFAEITEDNINFNLIQLKPKKIRQLQFYVKKKLFNHFKSKQHKKLKLKMKKAEKRLKLQNIQQKSIKSNEKLIKQQQIEGYKATSNIPDEDNQIFNNLQFQKNQPCKSNKSNKNIDNQSIYSEGKKSDNKFCDDSINYFIDDVSEKNIKFEQKIEKNMNDESNIEFVQEKLLDKFQPNDESDLEDFNNQSSDSSMITDQQDSQY